MAIYPYRLFIQQVASFVAIKLQCNLSAQVVLIGDAGVGKTCAVQRFKHGVYIERHGNTIGVDFMLKTVEVDGKKIKVCFNCST